MSQDALLNRLCAQVRNSATPLRVLVIAAHPDDETVSMGGRLSDLQDVVIAHVTDGAPRNEFDACDLGFDSWQAYAETRKNELMAALSQVGIGPAQLRPLGIPDTEVAFQMTSLSHRLVELLRDIKPALVLTHPYEGGHPDHDATSFAAHAACEMLARRSDTPPVIIEFTSYHSWMGQWRTGEFLLHPEAGPTVTVRLSGAARDLKRRMIGSFATQLEVLSRFPTDVERYRLAPRYDFLSLPVHGEVLYQRVERWGISGIGFTRLAGESLRALNLTGPI